MIIDIGEYQFSITNLPSYVKHELHKLYGSQTYVHGNRASDFTINVESNSFIRRFIRPQRIFYLDDQRIFNPVAFDKCLPSVEWAMNWCIGSYDHNHLLIHASVIEKNGKAIIFPASQGSGKSTLSSYLGLKSWNLYSDEFAIIDLNTGKVKPIYRPASLKNNAIDVIKSLVPNAVFSKTTHGTQKGAIAHVKTMQRDNFELLKPATIVGIVTPKYKAGMRFELHNLNMTQAFAILVRNSFNYSVLGADAFNLVGSIVSNAEAMAITYSEFSQIEPVLEEVVK